MSEPIKVQTRMTECIYRRPRSCALLDRKFGWVHGITSKECDTCWNAGIGSIDSANYRQRYVTVTISNIKSKFEQIPQPIREVVLARHSTDEERPSLAKRLPGPQERKLQTWWFIRWEGVPWPKRPFISLRAAWKAFRQTWRKLGTTGCGCSHRLKSIVRGHA